MMSIQSNIFKKAGQFYSGSVITKFLEFIKKQYMHVGYWNRQHPFNGNLYTGAKQFTDYMISLTDIQKNQLFIDFGCNFGLPGIKLAKAKGCRVLGVTASSYQAETANQKSLEEHLGNKAVFIVGDINNLVFSDNAFDGGWFFESIFHAGHESALQEAHRVLKHGALLLIADFIITGEISKTDLHYIANELGITSWMTLDKYPLILEKCGFNLVELKEITENTISKERFWGVHLDIINNSKEKICKIVEKKGYEYLKNFFTNLNKIAEKTIGYCLVQARNKK
jgi:SAM-dependent methyltransferase